MAERIKVQFSTEQQDGWPPSSYESLWAEPVAPNLYRLLNIPYYLYGVSYGDVVEVMPSAPEEKIYWVHRVAEHSGHSTYRIFLSDTTDDAVFERWWSQLANLGCEYERANDRLIAIDMAPNVDVTAAYRILEAGLCQDVWDFEEGFYHKEKAARD